MAAFHLSAPAACRSLVCLFSGFTPCLESADSGITSINWLYSFSGLGISTRITRTPYCAASSILRRVTSVKQEDLVDRIHLCGEILRELDVGESPIFLEVVDALGGEFWS